MSIAGFTIAWLINYINALTDNWIMFQNKQQRTAWERDIVICNYEYGIGVKIL